MRLIKNILKEEIIRLKLKISEDEVLHNEYEEEYIDKDIHHYYWLRIFGGDITLSRNN